MTNLKIYQLVDGVSTPFPNVDSQIEIFDYTYNAKRMGGAPSISATVMYPTCLDDLWDETVFAVFNGERYFLKQTPTSSKDNNDARYKHELELVSERIILDNVYFYDVVSDDFNDYKPVTNSTKVVFFGNIQEFVERLNQSLLYAKLQSYENGQITGYRVVIDYDENGNLYETEGKLITFEDQFFSGVLQEIYNVYELPYYFKGKEIHIGFKQDAIAGEFEYGVDNELLSITKTNANNKIVNRVTGVGSSDNIPYYYPNITEKHKDVTLKYCNIANTEIPDVIQITNAELYSELTSNGKMVVFTTETPDAYFVGDAYIVESNSFSTKQGHAFDTEYQYQSSHSAFSLKIRIGTKKVGSFVVPLTLTTNREQNIIVTFSNINGDEVKNNITLSKNGNTWSIIAAVSDAKVGEYRLTIQIPSSNKPSQITTFNLTQGTITNINKGYWLTYLGNKYDKLEKIGLTYTKHITPAAGDYILQSTDETTITKGNIKKQEFLMPPIYRKTNGDERFYNAINYSKEGHNLLLDSAKPISGGNSVYLLGSYNLGAIKPKAGDKVTLSFSGKLGDNGGSFLIYTSGWRVSLTTIYYSDFNDETNRFEKTFTWHDTETIDANTFINIFHALTITGESEVYDVKLEFGESATAYSAYNDILDSYIDESTGEFYEFTNPYVEGLPKEQVVSFEDIKPTIEGMTNASGERIDMFSEFAYDEDDNDETEEINGTIHYKHPYFFGKLRKFNGKNAFNPFDSAIDENEMTISMTSGHCGGCNFRVMVSDDDIKANTVQVYESDTTDADGTFHAKGSLKRDENGNVLCGRKPYQSAATPQDTQQDTINNEVWVALEKDLKTYGTIMPTRVVDGSSDTSIHPSTDDTFVILHTKLPQAYIDVAEHRLGKAIVKYMKDNNDEKFTFSIKFSRIYLAENPNVANLITENSLLYVKYNDKTYPLYVSSYSYKVSSNDALPEITVELKDEISVSQNALQNAITEVKGDFLDSFKNIDVLGIASPYFLRKDVDDRSEGKISASMGFEAGAYEEGISGAKIDEYGQADVENLESRSFVESPMFTTPEFNSGLLDGYGGRMWVDEYGKTNLVVDNISAREKLTVTELVIQKVNSIGGQLVISATNGEIKDVQVVYKEDVKPNKFIPEKYILTFDDDSAFMNDDFIRCSYWDNSEKELRSYWVKVSVDGDAASNVVYVDLKDQNMDVIPQIGDKVAQMGNETNKERQGVIIISTTNNKPYISIYDNINSANLDESKLKGRFGDLSSIVFNGKELSGYGIWSNNAYLNGEFRLSSTNNTIDEEISNQIANDASSRNYARMTSIPVEITDISIGTNITQRIYDVYGFTNGDTLTISFDWEIYDVVFESNNALIIMQFNNNYGYQTVGFRLEIDSSGTTKGSHTHTLTLQGKWDSSNQTASLPISKLDNGQLMLRFDNITISSGAYIKISNLRVNKGKISHDWEVAPEDAKAELDAYKNVVTEQLESLQNQVDGQVESWFGEDTPSKTNYPANQWVEDTDKEVHIGDTYTNTQTFIDDDTTPNAGKSWRWLNGDKGYDWYIIADTDATKALLLASQAQDTADGKRRVFVSQPTDADAYDVGDLWVNANYGDVYQNEFLRCKESKAENIAFSISHWEKASKYTDDTAINNLQIGGRNLLLKTNNGTTNWLLASSLGKSNYTIKSIDYNGAKGCQFIKNTTEESSWGELFLFDLRPEYIVKRQTYHLSFDMMQTANNNTGLNLYCRISNSNSSDVLVPIQQFIHKYVDGRWIHYDLELVATGSGIVGGSQMINFVAGLGENPYGWKDIAFANIKLEQGNKATTWTPAPEDIETELNQYKDEVTAQFEVTNGHFTSIQKVVKNNVGAGRNLLIGTNQGATNWDIISSMGKDNYTLSGVIYGSHKGVSFTNKEVGTTPAFEVLLFPLRSEMIQAGSTYHLSFDMAASNTPIKLNVGLLSSDGTGILSPLQGIANVGVGEFTHYDLEFTATASGNDGKSRYVYFGVQEDSRGNWDTIKVVNLQLEQSNTATNWSPAPEDAENRTNAVKEELSSSITQTAESIISSVDNQITDINGSITNLNTQINQTGESISLIQTTIVEGGRNLLWNTNRGELGWSAGYVNNINQEVKAGAYKNDLTAFAASFLGQAGYIAFDLDPATIKYGQKYTVQVLIQFVRIIPDFAPVIALDVNTIGGSESTSLGSLDNPTEVIGSKGLWKYIYTFEAKASGDSEGTQKLIFKGFPTSFVVAKDIQLETGEKATPYGIRTEEVYRRTGINITDGRIDVTSGQFIVRNNDGEITAQVDKDGKFITNAIYCKNPNFEEIENNVYETTHGRYIATRNEYNDGWDRWYYDNGQIRCEFGWDAGTDTIIRYYNEDGSLMWGLGNQTSIKTEFEGKGQNVEIYELAYISGGNSEPTIDEDVEAKKSEAIQKASKSSGLTNPEGVTFVKEVSTGKIGRKTAPNVNPVLINGWYTPSKYATPIGSLPNKPGMSPAYTHQRTLHKYVLGVLRQQITIKFRDNQIIQPDF